MYSYRDLLRQKYEQGHQMSGSALMGGVLGGNEGYEGAAILPALGKVARRAQKDAWKAAHPERTFRPRTQAEKDAFVAKMDEVRAEKYAKLKDWYDKQTAANGGKKPTAREIKIARAEINLARARLKPKYESKAGATQAALSKMSAQQKSSYELAAKARNAAQRQMSSIIKATEEMKM